MLLLRPGTVNTLLLLCSLTLSAVSQADSYLVSTLRASPGQLEQLLMKAQDYREAVKGNVLLMRHSQGDHWDLLLLEPLPTSLERPSSHPDFSALVDFQESFSATSDTPFTQLRKESDAAGLYHIEMFNALAGKHAALIDQRQRENQYLAATGQTSNAVFVSQFGSDVDVFTIGFHKDMAALDAGPTVSNSEAEAAARKAGFKNRADLGYYLRSLIIGHHDTLAVPVGN